MDSSVTAAKSSSWRLFRFVFLVLFWISCGDLTFSSRHWRIAAELCVVFCLRWSLCLSPDWSLLFLFIDWPARALPDPKLIIVFLEPLRPLAEVGILSLYRSVRLMAGELLEGASCSCFLCVPGPWCPPGCVGLASLLLPLHPASVAWVPGGVQWLQAGVLGVAGGEGFVERRAFAVWVHPSALRGSAHELAVP